MKWPFSLTLKSLVLDGKDKEKARAKHELSGEELDRKLLDIEWDNKESIDYKKAALEIDKKYNKVAGLEYEKSKATLNEEPWVGYKDYGLEENDGRTGFWFEFDWNEFFIKKLREEGYEGTDEEHLVRKWYAELCQAVALEEGLALDLFDTGEETSVPIRKKHNDDGTVDYS